MLCLGKVQWWEEQRPRLLQSCRRALFLFLKLACVVRFPQELCKLWCLCLLWSFWPYCLGYSPGIVCLGDYSVWPSLSMIDELQGILTLKYIKFLKHTHMWPHLRLIKQVSKREKGPCISSLCLECLLHFSVYLVLLHSLKQPFVDYLGVDCPSLNKGLPVLYSVGLSKCFLTARVGWCIYLVAARIVWLSVCQDEYICIDWIYMWMYMCWMRVSTKGLKAVSGDP